MEQIFRKIRELFSKCKQFPWKYWQQNQIKQKFHVGNYGETLVKLERLSSFQETLEYAILFRTETQTESFGHINSQEQNILSSHYHLTLSTFCKVHVQALRSVFFFSSLVSRIEVVKMVTSSSSRVSRNRYLTTWRVRFPDFLLPLKQTLKSQGTGWRVGNRYES